MLLASCMKGIEIIYKWMSHVDKNQALKAHFYSKLG